MLYRSLCFVAFLSMNVTAFGQLITTDPNDTSFFVRYAANLNAGDSVINITNSGANSTSGGVITDAVNGNLCANLYAYTPDEQLVACCACEVTPNGLKSLSVKNDLAINPLTPAVPTSLVVKILVTSADPLAAGGASRCTGSSPATVGTNDLVKGLIAWSTTIHALPVTAVTPAGTYGVTETEFHGSSLSETERQRMTTLCAFIRANGSGYGICKSCRLGGLGASSK